MKKSWFQRSMTGEKNTLNVSNQSLILAIVLLLMLWVCWVQSVIEYANNKRSKSNFQLKKSSIVTKPITNAVEVMWIECSTGERGRDSFQNNVMSTRGRSKNVQKIIWKPMNAGRTILSTRSLTIALPQMNKTSRRKSLRMVQLLHKWLSSLTSWLTRKVFIIELKMLSNSMGNTLSRSLAGKRM